MKVALYTRVSTQEQEPENQLMELREYCKTSGYTIYKEFTDKVSGGKSEKDRPQFAQMLKDASQKKFDLLLVWSLDRFTREGSIATINYLTMLNSYNVMFKSYTQQYFDTSGIFRNTLIALMADLAAQERLLLSDRVKAGMKRAKQAGLKTGRPKLKKKDEIISLIKQGLPNRQISKLLKVAESTVRNYRKEIDPDRKNGTKETE